MFKRVIILLLALALCTSLLYGCSNKSAMDETSPVSSISTNESYVAPDTAKIRLYFADNENYKLLPENRSIPIAETRKDTNSLATLIVNELIKGPANNNAKPTIPKGSAVIGPVTVNNRMAIVNFNKAFVDKHSGGSAAEQMTIYSIVNSLTELKDVDKVQFKIDGKIRAEYKGHFKFDVPFPRTNSLISHEKPVATNMPTATNPPKAKSTPAPTAAKKAVAKPAVQEEILE